MNITILGATGRTGGHLVGQALAAGHEVTAFVRNPAKLDVEHERLTVVQGDIHEADKVAAAVAKAEVVLSALGPSRNGPKDVMAVGLANIVAGMKQHGVRRLVVSTGAGVPAPQDRPTFMNKVISFLLKLISRDVLEDSLRGIQIVRESELDWTVVRGPMLIDGSQVSNYRVGFIVPEMGRTLSRVNFADFMLKQIKDDTYWQQMPVVSDDK